MAVRKKRTAGQSASRRAKAPPTEALGSAGTVAYGGFLVSPERSSSMVGTEKYRQFSDILVNTSIAAASVRYFLNLVGRARWQFKASEDDKDGEYAERVQDAVEGMTTPWHRVVRRAAMYRFYGFSAQEWVMRRHEDGWLTLDDIQQRPQSTIYRWDVERSGTLRGMVQLSPNDPVEIYLPRSKLLYAVDDSLTDSPEGLGLLRACAEPARRLRRYEQLEGFAFETDLRGIPIGRAPLEAIETKIANGDMTAAGRTQMLSSMTAFLTNHVKTPNLGMMLDSSVYRSADEAASPGQVYKWGVDLLKGGTTLQPDAARAIERLNREIARIIGTEFLMLGADGKGSLALSTDKSNAFYLTCDGTLTECKACVRKDIVETLFDLNGWDRRYMPEVLTEDVQFKDVAAIAAALKDMAAAGAILPPDDPAINVVREELGVPPVDPDKAIEAAQMASLGGGGGPVKGPGSIPGGNKKEGPRVRSERARARRK